MVHVNGKDIWISNGKGSLVLTPAQALMLVGQLNNAIEDLAKEAK